MLSFLQKAVVRQPFCKAHQAAFSQRTQNLARRVLKPLPVLWPALEGWSAALRFTMDDRNHCHLLWSRWKEMVWLNSCSCASGECLQGAAVLGTHMFLISLMAGKGKDPRGKKGPSVKTEALLHLWEAFLLQAVTQWSQVPCRGYDRGIQPKTVSLQPRVTSWRTGLSTVMRHEDLTQLQPSLPGNKLSSPHPPCLSDCF